MNTTNKDAMQVQISGDKVTYRDGTSFSSQPIVPGHMQLADAVKVAERRQRRSPEEPNIRNYRTGDYTSQRNYERYKEDLARYEEQARIKREEEQKALARRRQEESEAREQARREAEFNPPKEGDNNAGEPCALCQGGVTQCVTEVILTDTQTKDEYYWNSRANGRKPFPQVILAHKEAKIKYQRFGECDYGHKGSHCTDLYYIKDDVGLHPTASTRPVKWLSANSGDIPSLTFDNTVLTIPNGYYIIGKPLTLQRKPLTDSSMLILRILDFMVMSRFAGIPCTVYLVGTNECKGDDGIKTQTFAELSQHTLNKGAVYIAVFPEYKVSVDISAGFKKDEAKGIWSFFLKGKVEETIQNEKSSYELGLNYKQNDAISKLLNTVVNFLNKGCQQSKLFGHVPVTIKLDPPTKVTLKGDAKLAHKAEGLYIERSDGLTLGLTPLIALKVNVDLLDLFFKFSVLAKYRDKFVNLKNQLGSGASQSQVDSTIKQLFNPSESKLLIYADFSFNFQLDLQCALLSTKADVSPMAMDRIKVSVGAKLVAGLSYEGKVWIVKGTFSAELGGETKVHVALLYEDSLEGWKLKVWHDGLYVWAKAEGKVEVGGNTGQNTSARRSWSVSGEIKGYLLDKTTEQNPIYSTS